MTKVWTAVSCVTAVVLMTAPALAQGRGKPSGWGATVTLEPLLLAHGGVAALCNPAAAARAEWGVERIGKLLQLSDQQRALLNELKAAAVKAADLSAGACPPEIPRNSAERIAFMERRFEALGKATRSVTPHFQAFYAALSTDQRAQLDAGPRRWRRSP